MADAATNPYVGPRTFTYTERERFFGREREARDLLSLVIAERLVLFYAQSGAGKSSLLNTRLIPQLKEAGYAVLPMVRVGGELPEGVSDVDNIFVFNCLLHLHQRSGGPRRFAHMTLKDFLSRLTSPDGETYYYDDNAEPAEDMGAYEEPLHVLIIDQFEEIVTAHLERWQEREAFFRQLEEAMAADPLLWVVLTLREDYVAALDPYTGLLSNRLRARFYMQRMGYEAALEAVRRPAQQYGRPFAPGVAETLVDNLRQIRVQDTPATGPGQFVEPVQLQVVCYQLWENLKNREAGAITAQDVLEAGDVDTALASFYEEALANVLHDRRVYGVTELAVRQWFDQCLITEAGTRGMVYRGEMHTAEMPNLVVQLLEDRYVLRSEIRSGGLWYELIHDRFVEPIARANRAWWDKQSPLMRDAQAWQEANHDQGKLYLGAKLQEALGSAAQGEPEPVVAVFLAASAAEQHELEAREAARQHELEQAQAQAEAQQRRAEEQARVAGRLRRLLVALAVVFLLLVGVGIYAFVAQRKAEQYARLSFSRELAAAAINNLGTDPERSGWLALHAASVTYAVDKMVAPEAENALHSAVQALRELLTLAGHTGVVNGVAFSPDGTRLATASRDQTAKVWDASSGRELFTLTGHTADVFGVAFSPDGTRLATASRDQTAKVWDASSGRELFTLTGHTGVVFGVAFSPDGTRLATASRDQTAKVWDASSGRELFTLTGHTGEVNGVAFSPDGTRLATASRDQTAKVWDASSGRELFTFTGHTADVFGVAFSPDGTRLATTSRDTPDQTANRSAIVWDASSGRELLTLTGHIDELFGVAFSPDGTRLATASNDQTAKVWDASSGRELFTLAGHTALVVGVAFSPDGTRLATTSYDGTARVWDTSAGRELLTLTGHKDEVVGVAFSPDGTRLATTSHDRTAKVWDASSGRELLTLAGHKDEVVGVAFSPDGTRLATASNDQTAKVWDASSGRELFTLTRHKDEVVGVAFSPDGTRLATTSHDRTAKVWDASSGRELLTLAGHRSWVRGLAFSPDWARVATASNDGTAKVWDASSGRELLTLAGHVGLVFELGAVFGVAFSPKGTHLATASRDHKAKVWDASSGRELLTLTGHTSWVLGVAFSPDGTRLATASADKTAKVWDASSGRELLTLTHHTALVRNIVFSPKGTHLATASDDGTVRVYTLNIEDLMALVRARMTRSLTPQECQQYLHKEQGCPLVVAALKHVVEGNDRARVGDVDSAVASLQRALELDPTLRLNPEADARRFAAEALVGKGQSLAKASDVDSAVASLQRALELDPTLRLNPEADARRFAAEALVGKGRLLVRQSKVKDAIAAYAGAERLDPTLKISARSWNTLCRFGSLWRHADEVMFACERAVELQPHDRDIRGTRGVAKAITGDIKGAIEDFEYYIKKVKDAVKKSQRQRWVDALRAGDDPFTDEEIKTLFYQ